MPTNKNIDKVKMLVIAGVWAKHFTTHDLPVHLYRHTANRLQEAILKGYKVHGKPQNAKVKLKVKMGGTDKAMVKELTDNIWYFSAAKTYQNVRVLENLSEELKKTSAAMYDESGQKINKFAAFRDGYYNAEGDFIEGASQIWATFNEAWLKTEYETALSMANSASRWKDIESRKETLPFLQFKGNPDEVECEICDSLDGMTARVDDAIWSEAMPPQHFNCRCDVAQLDEDEGSEAEWSPDEIEEASKDADEAGRTDTFKMNAGKDKIIFKEKGAGAHPYFDVARGDSELKSKNFNLPKR